MSYFPRRNGELTNVYTWTANMLLVAVFDLTRLEEH
jgi:hypothetical protein